MGRFRWSCGLRRKSAAARLQGLRVWIPQGEWMSVYCECCALSGRGLCDEPITRPEESYQMWCLRMSPKLQTWGGLGPLGLSSHGKKSVSGVNKRPNCESAQNSCRERPIIKIAVSVSTSWRHMWGRRSIAPPILKLGTGWRWLVNITPRLLLPLERFPVPIG
jgi:hypothetical protein